MKQGEKMANKKDETRLSSLRERTHESVDKIMDKAESIGERGKEAMDGLKEKAAAAKENVDGYIRKNPEKSVLIAVGVGAVVGALLTAAMMRRKN